MKPLYAIIDLDGCISDDVHRQGLLPAQANVGDLLNSHFELYNAQAPLDRAVNLDIIKKLDDTGIRIIILTARNVAFKADALQWLKKKGVPFDLLMMRPVDDHRPSVKVKNDMIVDLTPMIGLDSVVLAIDDREEIVSMYREWGLPAHVVTLNARGFPTELSSAKERLAEALLSQEHMALRVDQRSFLVGPPGKQTHTTVVADASIMTVPWNRRFIAAMTPAFARASDNAHGFGETEKPEVNQTAADILAEAAATFRARNAQYKSNYQMIAPIVRTLFPDGVPRHLIEHDSWHIFELMLVKLSRFAISEFTHQDSIRDLLVYAAMTEWTTKELHK